MPEMKVVNACYDNGLMILPCGTNTIRFRPPLNITPEQIDEGLSIVEKSMHRLLQSVRGPGRQAADQGRPEPKSD